ncbi:sulfurtransferase [Salinisphaera sp. SPP-AMP-43]
MNEELPIFLRPSDLHAVMSDPGVQIVAVDSASDYASAHIPGALQIAMADFTASDGTTGGLIPEPAALAARLSDAGLRNDVHIVAYDRVGDGQAARLCYTLDAMGHGAFSVLDGGLAAWHAASLPLETGEPAAGASHFELTPRSETIADRAWIESHLDRSDTTFLDVRSEAEFAGEDVRSARGGHIPGAVNLDWQLLKDSNGQLRDLDTVRGLLAAHGIEPADEIVAYCQTHVRSSYVYLVLKALGYDRLRGYPGAWSDWGNQSDTPVEAGR